MSREEEEKEERRLNQCLRKYETMIKQFDELVEMMEVRSRPPKRPRSTRGNNSSNEPANHGEVFVQTITGFLHELKSDPNCSTSCPGRG
ncbi:hypothetical protein V6N13_096986 [Hibiscus sabdariffa]|uniref:Uncharacterized protein n=1 Tax=Hibiscus sabdariffa TaxID=183260 RepID=A0ABR2C0G8_9ROSI